MADSTVTKQPNRRGSRRTKAKSFVKLECRKGSLGLGTNVATLLMDVSETGARLVVNQELKLLQEVEIVFTGYGMTHPVKRIGNLRWQLKLEDGTYCIGIAFQKRLEFREHQVISSPS